MKFCTNCGKQLNDEVNFCGGCGTATNSVNHPQVQYQTQSANTVAVDVSYQNEYLVQNASAVDQAVFFRRTYLTAGIAFLAWMFTVYLFFNNGIAYSVLNAIGHVSWLVVLGIFWLASFIGNKLVFSKDKGLQFLGLGVYIIAYALIFIPLIYYVIIYSGEYYQVFTSAFIATVCIFAALTMTVFLSRTDFSFLRSAVVFGSFIALGAIIIFTVTGTSVSSWFAVAMIILMSATILFETHQIKTKFDTTQHVGAGATVFASFMVLLWYVINLFTGDD